MMKSIRFILFNMMLTLSLGAQQDPVIEVLSMGANYDTPFFYSIESGDTTTFKHSDWEIAFAVTAQSDLGVFVNEGVSSAGEERESALIVTGATDFASVDTAGMTRVYNNENSWEAGAFNHVRNPAEPFDFGWGNYDPATNQVNGTRVFVIQLRSGAYKKLKITSLDGGIYTFQYADLDGSNEVTQIVDKANFATKTLAYYSFASEQVLDLEPADWDILFTRYSEVLPLNDGSGESIDYYVSGALINRGVEVAQADGVDPQTVDLENFSAQFTDTLTVIGHDWKDFNLTTFQWSLPMDRVYFVKNEEQEVWKLQFIDFEGSSTGGFAMQKSAEGVLTDVRDLAQNFNYFQLSPNPASDNVTIEFQLNTAATAGELRLYNAAGQLVLNRALDLGTGNVQETIPLDLPGGMYQVIVASAQDFIAKPLLIRRSN